MDASCIAVDSWARPEHLPRHMPRPLEDTRGADAMEQGSLTKRLPCRTSRLPCRTSRRPCITPATSYEALARDERTIKAKSETNDKASAYASASANASDNQADVHR